MTLPASGQLTLAQIAAEFGQPAVAVNLSQYYRGAGIVPNVPENAAIPVSGPLSLSNFYGARGFITSNVVITAGYNAGGGAFIDWTGFRLAPQSPVIGSLVSGAGWLPVGVIFEAISSETPSASPTLRSQEVIMSGFSADPGVNFFRSATVGGVTRQTSVATSYTYFPASGRAIWGWGNQTTGWSFPNGVNATIAFVH